MLWDLQIIALFFFIFLNILHNIPTFMELGMNIFYIYLFKLLFFCQLKRNANLVIATEVWTGCFILSAVIICHH